MNKNLCELIVNLNMNGFNHWVYDYTKRTYRYFTAIDNKKSEVAAKIEKCFNYLNSKECNDNINCAFVYYDIEKDEICAVARESIDSIPRDLIEIPFPVLNANIDITEYNIADVTDAVITKRKEFGHEDTLTELILACISKI